MGAMRLRTPCLAVLLLLIIAMAVAVHPAIASASTADLLAVAQETIDTDGDGLDDAQEVELGTDPDVADTDGDGLTDGGEVGAQSDGYGTDPTLFDTDGDGFGDGDEIASGSDPIDPTSTPDSVGTTSNILVTKFTCPPGYDGNDFVGECAATEGVTFGIGFAGSEFFASEATNAEGLAPFHDISAGTYVIAEDIPGDVIDRIEVFCAAPGDTEPRLLTVNAVNSVTVEVLAGEELSCSWYNVPIDQMAGASAITVQAFLCPADYADKDLITACDEPLAEVGVTVGLDASEFGVEGETDAAGTVTFGDLGSGAYTVTLGVPGDVARFNATCGRHTEFEFSVIAAATTNQISFELLESDEVLCTFLVIPESQGAPTATPVTPVPTAVATAAPTKPAGPVASLPDTGAGVGSMTAAANVAPYLILVALIAMSGVLRTRRTRVR
jgi:hypothetical protein